MFSSKADRRALCLTNVMVNLCQQQSNPAVGLKAVDSTLPEG
jgi:hypothetical protein